jgi:hypothetical protein
MSWPTALFPFDGSAAVCLLVRCTIQLAFAIRRLFTIQPKDTS